MTIGTGLSGAGALALNQWRERDTDCVMRRTSDRPLPQGRVAPEVALIWSLALAIAGVGLLAGFVNGLAAAFSAATIILYVAVYTPLKRHTRWATEIGGIPGALPPLIGVAAAGGGITGMGWLVFALMWCWQMPHFFAIGWMCREDYRVAGFRLLPVIDANGARTAAWAFGYAAALLVVSVAPWTLGAVGAGYGIVALLAGAVMLALAWRFLFPASANARERAARQLFAASLIYLPVVLATLAIDRTW
jgi:heme o synthase